MNDPATPKLVDAAVDKVIAEAKHLMPIWAKASPTQMGDAIPGPV